MLWKVTDDVNATASLYDIDADVDRKAGGFARQLRAEGS